MISIHALLAENDTEDMSVDSEKYKFQSTFSAQRTTYNRCRAVCRKPISSSSLPHRERPKKAGRKIPVENISIHAPLTGSDLTRFWSNLV